MCVTKGEERACGNLFWKESLEAVMIRQKMRLTAGLWAGERRGNGFGYSLDDSVHSGWVVRTFCYFI